ncbi:MAG: hypothetical protein KF896_14270 [Ignavibacteriae bacterium]|nr:hypothetical protein [Ignavibacteriota bacterium]
MIVFFDIETTGTDLNNDKNDDGVVVFTFGNNKDKPAANHKDYLEWMLRSNFAPDTKQIIYQILKGEI